MQSTPYPIPGIFHRTTFNELSRDGTLQTTSGEAFIANLLPPSLHAEATLGKVFFEYDHARTALLRLDGIMDGLPGRTSLLAAIRVREAQASSKIEDTIASVRDIAIASLDETREGTPAMEVFRNRLAIEHGLASPLPISVRLLREMHEVLITEQRHSPGQFRDRQVYIGDSGKGFSSARFVPPPSSHVEDLMANWELFCNPLALNAPQRLRLPYFIELAIAHYQFEAIHPFSDGNGRLGRALVALAPVKDGELQYPVCNLSEWVQAHRQEYYDCLLGVSRHGDWEQWIRFFCTALAEQAKADLRRARALSSLYTRYLAQLTTARSNIVVTKLLDYLFEKQAVNVGTAARVMELSYGGAMKHIKNFESLGIIREMRGVMPRLYFADEVIKVIQGDNEV